MTRRRLVWTWVGVRIAAYLVLAGLALALWLYLASEGAPEIDPETGLAVPEISQVQEPPGFLDRLRVRLGW